MTQIKTLMHEFFQVKYLEWLNDLESKKYIKFLPTYGADYQNMCLTYKGLHYWYFTFEKMVSFLFKSVVVPIVVSVITTVITLYIKG